MIFNAETLRTPRIYKLNSFSAFFASLPIMDVGKEREQDAEALR